MKKLTIWKYYSWIFGIICWVKLGVNPIYLNILVAMNSWALNSALLVAFLFLYYSYYFRIGTVLFWFTWKLFWKIGLFFEMYTNHHKLLYTLWVGTINIHPILFYMSVIIMFVLLVSNSIYTLLITRITKFRLMILLAITLSLGGLWGLQSLTWGYVWVNDKIEWLLLCAVFLLVYQIHRIKYMSLVFFKNCILWLLISGLLLIRLNIISTRHSFLSNYPLSYVVLGILFIALLLLILNKPPLSKYNRIFYILIILYIGTFYYYSIYITKVIKFSLLYFSIFIFLKHWSFSSAYLILHLVFISFLLLWAQLFTYFYLAFTDANYSLRTTYNVYKISRELVSSIYQTTTQLKHQLEYINFTLRFQPTHYSIFNQIYSYNLQFTNFSVFSLLVLVVFFKDFELRLLYYKKAYF